MRHLNNLNLHFFDYSHEFQFLHAGDCTLHVTLALYKRSAHEGITLNLAKHFTLHIKEVINTGKTYRESLR